MYKFCYHQQQKTIINTKVHVCMFLIIKQTFSHLTFVKNDHSLFSWTSTSESHTYLMKAPPEKCFQYD